MAHGVQDFITKGVDIVVDEMRRKLFYAKKSRRANRHGVLFKRILKDVLGECYHDLNNILGGLEYPVKLLRDFGADVVSRGPELVTAIESVRIAYH